MPRFKSDPQRSWTSVGSSKPFPGTLLRNSLFPRHQSHSNSDYSSNSSSTFQVRSGLHPLGTLGEINDIQRCITEAILVHGQPCPQEYIINFVEARWKSLKHGDGTSGTDGDARQATLDQLYADPSVSHVLFEQSKSSSKPNRWMLATSVSKVSAGALLAASSGTPPPRASRPMIDDPWIDDDTSSDPGRRGGYSSSGMSHRHGDASSSHNNQSLPLRSTRNRRIKRKRGDDGFEGTSSDDEFPTELPGGRDAAYLLDLPRKKPKVYTPEELSYDASTIPADELLERVKESKLTNLQILISISIIRSSNYEARLDYILDFVCQHYTYLLGRDGNPKATDPKRAVLASLSKNASSSPLFVKIGDVWKIGPKNVLYGSKEVIPGLMEYITISKAPGDAIELTELQKMIMRAISLEGGTCGLEKIYEYVKPRYDRLKRRDGSSYATNARRAIQASLSNNSSNRPIFQLVGTSANDETLWSLTERGQESLDLINTNEPEAPFEDDSSFSEEPISSPMRMAPSDGPDYMDVTPSSSNDPHRGPTMSSAPISVPVATSSSMHSFVSSSFPSSAASLALKMDSGSLSPSSVTSMDGPHSDSEDDSAQNSSRALLGNASSHSNIIPMAF